MQEYICLYVGEPGDGPGDMSPEDIGRGMQAWGQWHEDHADAIVVNGGPAGRTKSVAKNGVTDIRNTVAGFVVVKAESHEAAAAMFENHPHFSIFPGTAVEVMPVMPVPTMD
ncbi:hypothetical protein GVN21_10450 [Caulobacter sp. SLTY]|uniref:hypothetical protein n=1 Tax=Caulobacter sp. SLTY TaxID=2683262 RepID=UPI0014134A56|nr:hypothetical protein [Caulobacter sp. SLTY]NBB15774.1 hypothetical protein [Caulobacter sp. SLTY]